MRNIELGRLEKLNDSLKELHSYLKKTQPDHRLTAKIEGDLEKLSWAFEDFLKFGKSKDFVSVAQSHLGLAKDFEGQDEVLGGLVKNVVSAANEILGNR